MTVESPRRTTSVGLPPLEEFMRYTQLFQRIGRKRCSTSTFVLVVACAVLPAYISAQATGTVDFTTRFQAIDGFGFADPFGRSGYLLNSPAIGQQVVDQLFNPVSG